jgi:hypothetical protein
LRERLRARLPGGEWLHRGLRLRHVEAQRHVAHRGEVGVVGERGLRVEGECQHRRRALFCPRHHEPARHHAGNETVAGRVLLDVADAPRRLARPQVHRELCVVRHGEVVEFAGAGHGLEHVGKVGHRTDRVGEGLHLLHELGVLDLVECAGAVRELHAGLELAVVLAAGRRLPGAGLGVQAFDRERLAAGAARGRQVRDDLRATDRCIDAKRGDRVDQRIELRRRAPVRAALGHVGRQLGEGRQLGGLGRRSPAVHHRLARLDALGRRLGPLRPGPARLPRAVRDHAGEHDTAERCKGDRQGIAHRPVPVKRPRPS